MHSASQVEAAAGRDRFLILIALAIVVALSWGYLAYLSSQMAPSTAYDRMMAEMGMPVDRPWTAADVFFTFVMWTVMMIGMMGPSAVPVLLLFAAARTGLRRSAAPRTLLFALGYLAVWATFSAVAALTQWTLHETALLSPAMSAASPWLAGAILVAAGAYQLTPLKGRCLTHCRTPLGFLMTNWRDGWRGALEMGGHHGAYCLGCCWGLMLVLFAVGVMNLTWVAALTVLVLLEKVAPRGEVIARVAGAAIIAAGILRIATSV